MQQNEEIVWPNWPSYGMTKCIHFKPNAINCHHLDFLVLIIRPRSEGNIFLTKLMHDAPIIRPADHIHFPPYRNVEWSIRHSYLTWVSRHLGLASLQT